MSALDKEIELILRTKKTSKNLATPKWQKIDIRCRVPTTSLPRSWFAMLYPASTQEPSSEEMVSRKGVMEYNTRCQNKVNKGLVLGNQGRSFRRIFDLAQKQLREYWGMEMRELPVREKVSLQEKRQGM